MRFRGGFSLFDGRGANETTTSKCTRDHERKQDAHMEYFLTSRTRLAVFSFTLTVTFACEDCEK